MLTHTENEVRQGAVVQEFSTHSRDGADAFMDPGIKRETVFID